MDNRTAINLPEPAHEVAAFGVPTYLIVFEDLLVP